MLRVVAVEDTAGSKLVDGAMKNLHRGFSCVAFCIGARKILHPPQGRLRGFALVVSCPGAQPNLSER